MPSDPERKRYPRPENFIPEPTFPAKHRYAGRARCIAWNVNQGRQCAKLPKRGSGHPADPDHFKTVCRSHGGNSRSGIDHPGFTSGRYSKEIPDRLLSDYQRMIGDENQISLREEIALLDLFISSDLRGYFEADTTGDWRAAKDLVERLRSASARGSLAEVRNLFGDLELVLNQGIEAGRLKGKILEQMEIRRRLADTQRKLLIDQELYITAEQQVALLAAVVDIIASQVKDADLRRAIAVAIRGFVASRYRRSIGSSDNSE